MIIAMTLSMSGGRYDDRQWPPVGVPFEVPDWEGEGLVRDHNAVRLPDPPAKKAVPEPPPEPGPEPVWISDAGQGPVPAAEAPSQSDPKQAWIAWAVSRGEDEMTAGNMTKADLMSKHGGRL